MAHGAGTADGVVVDRRDGLDVPPASPLYRLRRVWLNAHEERGYYYGFANEGLWPLCHRAHVQPVFRSDDFEMYRAVNARFAEAVCDEVESESPLILVQDYHFALAPQVIRERLPLSTHRHVLAYSVAASARLRDLSVGPPAARGSARQHHRRIPDAGRLPRISSTPSRVRSTRTSTAARNVITYAGRQTTVRAYPVSVEWPSRWACQSPPIETCRDGCPSAASLQPDVRLGVGVDRLDYTKGINEKFLAVERLLELHPEFRERFVFVQIAEPSRNCLPAYRELPIAAAGNDAIASTSALASDELPPHRPARSAP